MKVHVEEKIILYIKTYRHQIVLGGIMDEGLRLVHAQDKNE